MKRNSEVPLYSYSFLKIHVLVNFSEQKFFSHEAKLVSWASNLGLNYG